MRFMSCLNKMTICPNYDFHYNRPILRFQDPIGKPPGQLQSHHPEAADLGETFRREEMEGQRLTERPWRLPS